ncbi:MAG TPA: DUF6569 family protein [Chthonomonadales bacterium]|nr:DUF6569 family protein [Chthonomonadales bacterium]
MSAIRAALALLAALAASAALAQQARTPSSPPLSRTLGAPRTFGNLTVIPVYDPRATASARVFTLDEALRAGVAKVRESGRDGDVNRVLIDNHGDRPIYILGGEVVLGGKQDRCVGQNTIVPPRTKAMGVTVFCVEHGRWSGTGDFDQAASAVAQKEVRLHAQEGGFAASRPAPSPTQRARRGAEPPGGVDVGVAQDRVWAAVAARNRRFGAESSTGTYRQVVQSSAGGLSQTVRAAEEALLGALGRDPKLVGVVVAVNNRVVGADVFSDSALFRKMWPRLLRGYATDAAEVASEGAGGRAPMTASGADAFLRAAVARGRVERTRAGEMLRERVETDATVVHRTAGRAMGGTAGAQMPALRHENILRK